MMIEPNKVRALSKKDFKDALKNGQCILLALLPILFTALYRYMNFGDGAQMEPGFVLTLGLLMSISLLPISVMSMMIAEEKEKNTLRTLMLNNVSAGDFLLSKALVIFTLSLCVNLVIFALTGSGIISFGRYVLVTACSSLCMILFGALIGLLSKNQMATGMLSAPAMLLFLLPSIFAQISPGFEAVARFIPTYAMIQLLTASTDTLFYVGVIIVWTVLAVLLFTLVYRKKRLD